MTTLLLNLRQVPDDEAEEVRALLNEHRIAFYETTPSLWGISPGVSGSPIPKSASEPRH